MPSIEAWDVPLSEVVTFDNEDFRISEKMVRQSRGGTTAARAVLFAVPVVAIYCGAFQYVVIAVVLLLVMPMVPALAGKRYSAFVAARTMPGFMQQVDIKHGKVRAELLKGLKGKVLDFGSGGGAYISYSIEHGASVATHIALEPNKNCHPLIRARYDALVAKAIGGGKTAGGMPALEIVGSFLSDWVREGGCADGTLDWIILGNVLCEAPEPGKQLEILDRLLKPGGRVYFSEHVREDDGRWQARLQDALAPWWELVSDGCCCNRRTLQTIKQRTGWVIRSWTLRDSTLPWLAQFELGVAVKPR